MGVLPECTFVHHVCAESSEARRKHQSPRIGVTYDCELPCRYKGSNPVPGRIISALNIEPFL